MAILLYENGEKIYKFGQFTGVAADTSAEKKRADLIDASLEKAFNRQEKIWVEMGFIKNNKIIKNSALHVWYDTGRIVNNVADEYNIFGTHDEFYYWQAINHYIKSNRDGHFQNCSILAKRHWEEVKSVGNWSVWRDILDTKNVVKDERVLDWIVSKVKNKHLGHKEIRKITQLVAREMKFADTSVLSNDELFERLEELKL